MRDVSEPLGKNVYLALVSGALVSGLLVGLQSGLVSNVEAAMVDYSGLEALFEEPVTTSAIGKPQRVSDTAVSMQIISENEIRRSGAVDIPQLLKRLAGVDVARNFRGHADVNIRGFNQPFANRMLVLINDRQVYMDNMGMTIWQALPIRMSEIKQIEVVRGPNTSLFGFNAASGVVNIVTYNPLFDQKSEVSARVGSRAFTEAAALMTVKPRGDVGARLSAGVQMADGFDANGEPLVLSRDNSVDSRGVHLDSVYKHSSRSSIRAIMGHNSQITDTLMPFYVPAQLSSETDFWQLMFHHDAQSMGAWKMQLYRNKTDYTILAGRFSRSAHRPEKSDLTVWQMSGLLAPMPNLSARLGSEYRENKQAGNLGSAHAEYKIRTLTMSAMLNWQINEQLTTTGSISAHRWDAQKKGAYALLDPVIDIEASDYNREDRESSFNLGVLYHLGKGQTLRAAYGKGLHLPSMSELSRAVIETGEQPGSGMEAYGNPRLESEKNSSVEIGYHRRFRGSDTAFSTLTAFTATLFYQRLDRVIASAVFPTSFLNADPFSNPRTDFTFVNAGDASNYGIEMMLFALVEPLSLSWDLSYTFIQHKDREYAVDRYELDFEDAHPKHRLSLAMSYTRDRWLLDLDVHYVSAVNPYNMTVVSLDGRLSGEVDAYVQLNMRLAYRLSPQVTFSLDGFNLFDEHNERPEYVKSMEGGLLGGNEIGRAMMASFRYRF